MTEVAWASCCWLETLSGCPTRAENLLVTYCCFIEKVAAKTETNSTRTVEFSVVIVILKSVS